jgi:hypothetical protein
MQRIKTVITVFAMELHIAQGSFESVQYEQCDQEEEV